MGVLVHYAGRLVILWLAVLFASWQITKGASPALSSDCPLDFTGLDFTSTVASCTNLSYSSCCDHSKALVAVAMSQYARETNHLSLPPELIQPCMNSIRTAFEEKNARQPVAIWCALNMSVMVDSPCKNFRDAMAVRRTPAFKTVEVMCGVSANLPDSTPCSECMDAQAKFLGSLMGLGMSEASEGTWRSCTDAVFLSIASLGSSDYAMERANCFFQLQARGAALKPQSRCPVTFNSDQVSFIAKSCSNSTPATKYKCCASALLSLRVTLTQTLPTSTTFVISEKQGAACIKDLDTALLTQDLTVKNSSKTGLQATCNILPQQIFHDSTHGCHGISTTERLFEILRKEMVDYDLIQASCRMGTSTSTCEQCRQGIMDATYVVAVSTGGSGLDPKTLQSCSDLVFLALASNSTLAYAADLGTCLYTLPDFQAILPPGPQLFAPAPGPAPPAATNLAVSSKAVAQSFTRLTIVLEISMVVIGLSVTFLVLLVVYVVHRKRNLLQLAEEKPLAGTKRAVPVWFSQHTSRKHNRTAIKNWRKDSSPLFRHFKFVDIRRATDNFSNIIGQGGFGTVYKAKFEDGLIAAVKRMNKGVQQGEEDFSREMELLGRLHHRHLVTLRGFCIERHDRRALLTLDQLEACQPYCGKVGFCVSRFLVYDYCENGSLKELLHGQVKSPLTWRTRLEIALGVAAGLEYLHAYCEPPLCHRDIKSSNILLDEDFVAKVADFGLAHAAKSGATMFEPVFTEVRGTPGYMDPEYVMTHELTEKSDVYSFGVLLLELISARRAINNNEKLVDWAQKYMDNDSKVAFLIDSDLEHAYNSNELLSLITIIKLCTREEGKARPSMRKVVQLLYDTFHLNSGGDNKSSLMSGLSSRASLLRTNSTPPCGEPSVLTADLCHENDGSMKSVPSTPQQSSSTAPESSHNTWLCQSLNLNSKPAKNPSVQFCQL